MQPTRQLGHDRTAPVHLPAKPSLLICTLVHDVLPAVRHFAPPDESKPSTCVVARSFRRAEPESGCAAPRLVPSAVLLEPNLLRELGCCQALLLADRLVFPILGAPRRSTASVEDAQVRAASRLPRASVRSASECVHDLPNGQILKIAFWRFDLTFWRDV